MAQIEQQVKKRSNIPGYRKLLMAAAVRHGVDGRVEFNTEHPSWKELVLICRQAAPPHKVTANSKPNEPVAKQVCSVSNGGISCETDWVDVSVENLKGSNSPIRQPSSSPSRPKEGTQISHVGMDSLSDSALRAQLLREIEEQQPDLFLVRHACKKVGVPAQVRGKVWKLLLGHGQVQQGNDWWALRTRSLGADGTAALDLPNQRVLKADIQRTLPHLPRFQDSGVRGDMEVLLTEYCKSHLVSYKQGMNYIMAPFFLVLTEKRDIYNCFCSFVACLLPNTFTDEEFGGLQCVFTLFRFLLLYHDPELCTFLDHYDMGPELYSSSWFITLYANRLNPDVLFRLWDLLLLGKQDPQLHYFVSLSLLISQRKKVLEEDEVSLPETLSRLTIASPKEVSALVGKATRLYRAQTSATLRNYLASITARKVSVDGREYQNLSTLPCLFVSAKEVVDFCCFSQESQFPPSRKDAAKTSAGGRSSVRFFILDCRPQLQYASGHLSCAFHLDPALLRNDLELGKTVENLFQMQGACHLVFFGEGAGQSPAVKLLNLYFLQKGFKYVSFLEGGYEACHALIMSGKRANDSLVDHNPAKCLQCQPDRVRPTLGGAGKVLSSFRKHISGWGGASQPTTHGSTDYQGNLPANCVRLPATAHLHLLHSVFRDARAGAGGDVQMAVDSLTALVVARALEFVAKHDVVIPTRSGHTFPGLQCTAVCCITTVHRDRIALQSALMPLTSVLNAWPAQANVGPDTPTGAVAPAVLELSDNNLDDDTHVFIFLALLLPTAPNPRKVKRGSVRHASSVSDALSVVEALRLRQVPWSRITVLCLLAARPALWQFATRFPEVCVVCSAVDDFDASRGGLVPGV